MQKVFDDAEVPALGGEGQAVAVKKLQVWGVIVGVQEVHHFGLTASFTCSLQRLGRIVAHA